MDKTPAAWKDKILFTPGPLTTSPTVKQAMLRDLGSRDFEFVSLIREVRTGLLELGGVAGKGYECVLLQGSGTFGIEGVVSTALPKDGKLLVVINGAYGRRMRKIADVHGIAAADLVFPEDQLVDPAAVAKALDADQAITHVGVIHGETTTGVVNDIAAIGAECAKRGKRFIVDAMSSFGAVPVDLAAANIDFLVSSSNKCIEGSPGFSFVLAKKTSLVECEGRARTLTLDILDQWKGLEANGQFRFTPPTHSLLAFRQAMRELADEGGIPARAARYRANHEATVKGMTALGFELYLAPAAQGPVITSFRYPTHPAFKFEVFYEKLNARNYVIYPGKVSDADCFRIGHIGRITVADVRDLIGAVRDVLDEMGVVLR